MAKPKDRIGDKIGDLEVISYAGKPDGKHIEWNVICRRLVVGVKCGALERLRVEKLDGSRVCCQVCAGARRSEALRASWKTRGKREWTSAMDDAIRRTHRERAGKQASSIPSYAQLGRRWSIPKHAVIARARELGLAVERKEPVWSERELFLLERFSWQTPKTLSTTLSRAGFSRSVNSITVKRRRLKLVASRIWMTRNDLMCGLGIDNHRKVERWVEAGQLYGHWREHDMAEPKEEEGHPGKRGQWIFHRRGVRRFLLMFPMEADFRKVDQLWFLDLIMEGNIGENFTDVEEAREMKRGRKAGFVQTDMPDGADDFDDDEVEQAERSAPGEVRDVGNWRAAEEAAF